MLGKDGSSGAAAGEIEGNKVATGRGTVKASAIELAASLEDRPNRKPVLRLNGKPDAKVVEVKIEKAKEDYIEFLRTRPVRRLTHDEGLLNNFPELRECTLVTNAHANKIVDMHEDILRQYDTKGYAFVGVEYLDDGMKRLFQVTEEDDA